MRPGVTLLAAMIVSLAGPTLVEAQRLADSAPEPALVSHSGAGLQFQPFVDFKEAVLSVSGGEVAFRQVYAGGEYPSISRYDMKGGALPDGTYNWELALLPDAATARELRIAAARNGGEAPNAWLPQTGTFTIKDGSFVDPKLVEPVAVARQSQGVGIRSATSPDGFRRRVRPSADLDASGVSEAEVRAAAASAQIAAASAPGAGFQDFNPSGVGDSDAGTLELGQSLEEAAANQMTDSSTAPIAHRSIEPGGKNGRPTGDE